MNPAVDAMMEGPIYAQLSTLTGMTEEKWRDILALDPDGQALVLRTYREASWAKSPDTLSAVLNVLTIASTVLSVVSGGEGAITAIAALKTL